MDKLLNKINSYIDHKDSVVEKLDDDDLQQISDLMDELNKSGRNHLISEIRKGDGSLFIKTYYQVTILK